MVIQKEKKRKRRGRDEEKKGGEEEVENYKFMKDDTDYYNHRIDYN